MGDNEKETPQKKYFSNRKKRFQSPLLNRRTWDVPSTRKTSSPFRKPTPLRTRNRANSPSSIDSNLSAGEAINDTYKYQNVEEDLLSWMSSLKQKAINILETEKLEEKKFYKELRKERSLLEKKENIYTDSFDRLKDHLNNEFQFKDKYASESENEEVSSSNEFHSEADSYVSHKGSVVSSDNESIPDEAVIDISSDDKVSESEEEEPHYDPSLFVDHTTEYRATNQTRSMYDPVDPFGSNLEDETNYQEVSQAATDDNYSYEEDQEELYENSESDNYEKSDDYDLQKSHEVAQEPTEADNHGFEALAAAAYQQSKDEEEFYIATDAQSMENAEDISNEPEGINLEFGSAVDEEEGYEDENEDIKSFESQSEAEYEDRDIDMNIKNETDGFSSQAKSLQAETKTIPFNPMAVAVNFDELRELEPTYGLVEVDIEKDLEPNDLQLNTENEQVLELHQEETSDNSVKIQEEEEDLEQEFKEQKYFDSDDEPFEDPSTSLFGQLSPGRMMKVLSSDEEYEEEEIGKEEEEELQLNQLQTREGVNEIVPEGEKPESGSYEEIIDADRLERANIAQSIEDKEAEQREEEEQEEGHESFVSFFDSRTLLGSTLGNISFAQVSDDFVKSVSSESQKGLQHLDEKVSFLDQLEELDDKDHQSEPLSTVTEVERAQETIKDQNLETKNSPILEQVIKEAVENVPPLTDVGETTQELVEDLADNIEEYEGHQEQGGEPIFSNLVIEQVEVGDYVYPEDRIYPVDQFYENEDQEQIDGYDHQSFEGYFEENQNSNLYPEEALVTSNGSSYNESEIANPVQPEVGTAEAEQVPTFDTPSDSMEKPSKKRGIFSNFFDVLSNLVGAATIDTVDSSLEGSPKLKATHPDFINILHEAEHLETSTPAKREISFGNVVNEFVEETANIPYTHQTLTEPESDDTRPTSPIRTGKHIRFNDADDSEKYEPTITQNAGSDEESSKEFDSSESEPSEGSYKLLSNFPDAVSQFVGEMANDPQADETTINETVATDDQVSLSSADELDSDKGNIVDAISQFVEETANVPHADETTIIDNSVNEAVQTQNEGSNLLDAISQFVEETANVPHADETTFNESTNIYPDNPDKSGVSPEITDALKKFVVETANIPHSGEPDLGQKSEISVNRNEYILGDTYLPEDIDQIDYGNTLNQNFEKDNDNDNSFDEPLNAEILEIEKTKGDPKPIEPKLVSGNASNLTTPTKPEQKMDFDSQDHEVDTPIEVSLKPRLSQFSALSEFIFSNDTSQLSILPDETVEEESIDVKEEHNKNISEVTGSKRRLEQTSDIDTEPNSIPNPSPRKRRKNLSLLDPGHIIMQTRSGKILGAQTDEEVKEAEVVAAKERELLENIAHGDVGTSELKQLVEDYEFIEELDYGKKSSGPETVAKVEENEEPKSTLRRSNRERKPTTKTINEIVSKPRSSKRSKTESTLALAPELAPELTADLQSINPSPNRRPSRRSKTAAEQRMSKFPEDEELQPEPENMTTIKESTKSPRKLKSAIATLREMAEAASSTKPTSKKRGRKAKNSDSDDQPVIEKVDEVEESKNPPQKKVNTKRGRPPFKNKKSSQ